MCAHLHHCEDDHTRVQLEGLPDQMHAFHVRSGHAPSSSKHTLAEGTHEAQVQDLRCEDCLHARILKVREDIR